jgi:dihydroxyacetone kinase
MAHIYADPAGFKDDMVAGFLAAYGRYMERVPDASAVMRRGGPRAGKVSLIIGGGSGHYPAFCGTVGAGLADAAVIGDIFTSPSEEQAYRTGRVLDGGAGVLFSYGNYAGDVLNFGAAQDRLRADGIDCRTVLVTDDIASAPAAEADRRRGIAGDFTVFKVAGAAADRGDSLDGVERLARLTNDRTRSFGVAFAGCTLPGQREPLFTVDDGSMELGLGIHGEPGIRSVERMAAPELAKTLLTPLLSELSPGVGGGATGRVAVILNGLGGTKYEELFVLWKYLAPLLADAGLTVVLPEVGELVTSLDMGGASLTLTWLDDELEELWAAPADTPGFRRGSVADLPRFDAAPATGAVDAKTSTVEHAADVESAASPASRRAARAGRLVLDAMLATMTEHEAELGRIDAVAGDGDHGSGMVRGLTAATTAARESDGGVGSVLAAAGAAWGDRAGGTSGMLWGLLLRSVGAELGDTEAVGAERLAAGIRRGIAELTRVGKAKLGDKTMMDALIPFADAFEAGLARGLPGSRAADEAADLTTAAAGNTARLVPKVGRARPLAERSVGTPDAGATSMALCVHTLGPVLAGHCEAERREEGGN